MIKPEIHTVAACLCLFACTAVAQDGAELLQQSGIQGGVGSTEILFFPRS